MKIALGTAQLGSHYGIANDRGKFDQSAIQSLLDAAQSLGVDTIDTAISYGDAETALGRHDLSDFKVITKVKAPQPEFSRNNAGWLRASVSKALERLNIDCLYAVLLHDTDWVNRENVELYCREVERLKSEGLIKLHGVSIYSPDELEAIYALTYPSLVQAPYNAFDRRLQKSGWLNTLYSDGVEVHARSLFLQGLLLLPQSEIPNYFSSWVKVFDRWHGWLKSEAIDPLTGCLASARDPRIEKYVVGVDAVSQLTQLIAASKNVAVTRMLELGYLDESLVDPRRWAR